MKVGYLNYAFHETHELTLAGATVETGALANLRVPQMDQKVTVRSAGTGPRSLFLQDLPESYAGRDVQVVALLDIAVETVGAISAVQFSIDTSGSSGSVSTTPVAVPLMPDGFPRHLLFLLPAVCTDCQQVRIWCNGAAAISAETELALTAGALFVGPVFELQAQGVSLSSGDVLEIEHARTNQRTPGGQDYGDSGAGCRKHSGSSIWLDQAAVFGDGSGGMDLQALMMACGTSRPILFLPDTSSAHMLHRTAIYGQFTSTGRINRQQGKWRWDGWGVLESR